MRVNRLERRRVVALLAIVGACLPGLVRADDAAGTATRLGSAPTVVVKLLHYDIQVDKSGFGTVTIHAQLQAANTAAAKQIMQQPVPYSVSMTDVDILDAFTLKPDGRKFPVATDAIFVEPVPGAPQMPMFDDQRQKVIVFPQVEAGDSVDFTYRYRDKQTLMPGAFTMGLPFSRLIAYNDVDVTVTAPADYPLFVETHEMAFDTHTTGSATVYHWQYSSPTPVLEDPSVLSNFDRSPRLIVSSFANYDAFAHAYAALAAPRMAVTPKIQATADEITSGISDSRRQAKKIYEWVSKHIHYVAVEIGTGAIIPHDADTVLSNGYGDCKDHAALFSALLKAKGIAGTLVLVNAGNSYILPDTPIVHAFNHAITWLPEFDLYADTTAGIAPFGTLPFPEYGKPVLRIVPSGPAAAKTPVLTAGDATLVVKTDAHLDGQGNVTGQTTTTATGPFSVMLRNIGQAIQATGPERAASGLLQKQNIAGSGSFTIPSPDDLDAAYSITTTFSIGPMHEMLIGRRFEMPRPLAVVSAPGAELMGPLGNTNLRDDEPTPCFSGREQEDISLDAPASYRFLSLPPDTDVKTGNLTFAAHWSLSGRTLTVHREFSSTVKTALCSGDLRRETAKAFSSIRDSYLYGAAIVGDGTP